MKIDGFTDATALVRPGIYVLALRGRVVFVGRAKSGMLARIAAHRDLAHKSMPSWFPVKGIAFDEVFIRYVNPDALDAAYEETLAKYPTFANTNAPVTNLNIRRV